MKRIILAALTLFLAVAGQADQADDTAERQWVVFKRDNGAIEEGFQIDGKRVGHSRQGAGVFAGAGGAGPYRV